MPEKGRVCQERHQRDLFCGPDRWRNEIWRKEALSAQQKCSGNLGVTRDCPYSVSLDGISVMCSNP